MSLFLLTLYIRVMIAMRRACNTLFAASLTAVPGQGLVEYGLVLVLIMVVCVTIIGAVGQTISSVWYDKLIPAFP